MIESIPLNKITCESNRKYTKDDSIDQLVNSIEQYGIIHAPTVRRIDDDQFKIIAGRRRIEAKRRLKHTYIDCEVKEKDDPLDDEEIALAENVNRQEMHPLDEAAGFKRMVDAGSPIEEISHYYARSPASIYKRMRLCGLINELKEDFRDEKINITGAVLIAELPHEDQMEFFKLYEAKEKVEAYTIADFIKKKQRYVIKKCMQDCEGCCKRTHNKGNELFEEYQHLEDVCLDAGCYHVKWYGMLEARIKEQQVQMQEAELQTDKKIYFFNGTPELIYKKATFVNIVEGGQNVKYEILRTKDYEFTGESSRKKETCWEVREFDSGIIVRRIGYKEKPPREKSVPEEISNASKRHVGSDLKDYGTEAINEVAKERGIPAREIVSKLQSKDIRGNYFKNDVKDLVCERVIAKRIEAEKGGSEAIEAPKDYLSMFLKLADDDMCSSFSLIENEFNEKQKQWYKELIGDKSISKISAGLSGEAQNLFHFLILSIGFDSDMPNLEDLKDIEKHNNIFWKYASISKDEYREMYLQAAKEVAAKTLDPKTKKKT